VVVGDGGGGLVAVVGMAPAAVFRLARNRKVAATATAAMTMALIE
jgi:hypothetical protein